MKNLFLTIALLISLFFSFASYVKAQNTLPAPTIGIAVMGLNCGNADSPGTNACCVSSNNEVDMSNQPWWMTFLTHIPLVSAIDWITSSSRNQRNQLGIQDQACQTGVPSTSNASDPGCICVNAISPSPSYIGALNSFCQSQYTQSDRNACLQCANQGGVFSGIGCVQTDFKSFIEQTVFGIGVGLAGGFSLLCIIYAAFMMQSSQGNPEKLKKAQEMITSCIMGLMLIIFSVFILKLIGVNILRIPGFG